MDQTTIIQSLLTGNSIYNSYREHWKYLLDSYMGGLEYRQGGYLMRYQLETAEEYAQRLNNTPYDNHPQSVVSVYMAFLFREEPAREFGGNVDPQIAEFLKDADLDGRSLNSFMKDVATWASVFGMSWVVVAKPDVGAITRADELSVGARPYVNLLTPLAVLDWRYQRSTSGRYSLAYFKYVEDINGDVRVVKEWTNEIIRTTQVNIKSEEIIEQYEEVNGLGMIPAVCAYNGRSAVRGLGVSDIADISDASRFIYNMMSEVQQSAVLDSHPSLVVTPDAQIGTGAGAIIRVAENSDPGLKPYLLEYSGASIDAMLNTIQHTVDSIDKQANMGSIRAVESRMMSGVSREVEFQLLNARLAEKADQMELAEEQIWRLWCAYQGYDYRFEIDYPGSFSIRDTGNELQQLQTAKNTATNPEVVRIIDEKLVELLGVDPEDYAPEQHAVTTPVTRTTHIQEMIMSGYTDAEILKIHTEITQEDIDTAKRALLNV